MFFRNKIAVLGMFVGMVPICSNAEIAVEEKVLQQGVFAISGCKKEEGDSYWNPCRCESDIRYPEIRGFKNAAVQTEINDTLKRVAQEDICDGTQEKDTASAATAQEAPTSITHGYEITFQSPDILAFRLNSYAYTGGAHGNSYVDAYTVDVVREKLLTITDILKEAALPEINEYIYQNLSARPEGEVFPEQLEGRRGAFITAKDCPGCALALGPEGVSVLFRPYEISSFAQGVVEVLLPQEFIDNASIVAALSKSSATNAAPAH